MDRTIIDSDIELLKEVIDLFDRPSKDPSEEADGQASHAATVMHVVVDADELLILVLGPGGGGQFEALLGDVLEARVT